MRSGVKDKIRIQEAAKERRGIHDLGKGEDAVAAGQNRGGTRAEFEDLFKIKLEK